MNFGRISERLMKLAVSMNLPQVDATNPSSFYCALVSETGYSHLSLYSLTWSAAVQISSNKRKFLLEKKVQSPQDFSIHQHGRRFIVLYTSMAAVTSCDNDL